MLMKSFKTVDAGTNRAKSQSGCYMHDITEKSEIKKVLTIIKVFEEDTTRWRVLAWNGMNGYLTE